MVLYIGAMYYLSGGIGVAYYLGSVFVYFFIFYAIYLLVKKIRIQGAIPAREFLDLFLYRIHLIIFIVVAILGVFSVYQNEISPAKTPQYTLQNGKKTVVFQTMSHIATEDFYDQVQAMITGKKAE
ncbi:MAG: hypothetical protein H6767_07520 [Candidatus Peribacteria bacterium]|nr:MAG: hypothetical protein H6767_07520 [Candidatus Peribacteria bacterium]